MDNIALNDLQKEFLAKFFMQESRFFLTGGAALVGYYLGHRRTEDLDLFTLENEIEGGFAIVNAVAREMGAEVESIQTSPDFRRLLVRRNQEAVVIDLVREFVYQINKEKSVISGVRVDSPEEILANKLCALLSRSEVRDLVDVRAIEKAGYPIENAIDAATKKDSGFTPAQLAWVLSQVRFGDDLIPPGGILLADLREYLDELLTRLSRIAFPTA